MRSRFHAELSHPEINAYLEQGHGLALLPVGSLEMHGPHLPTATDTYIARAIAVKLAEAADGLVLPDVVYSWAGSPDGFAGTISIEPELLAQTLESIARQVFRAGFTRLAFINMHGGNHFLLPLLTRRFYEKYLQPVIYLTFLGSALEDAEAIQAVGSAEEWAKAAEASLLLAALQVLGKPDLYPESAVAYEDEAPPYPAEMRAINTTVGYFMQDPRQHACPSRHASLTLGLEVLDRMVASALPSVQAIESYAAYSQAQANQGWQR